MEQPALSDFIWIDQEEKLPILWDDLSRHDVFAIDTESNSFHGYISKICLLQIATPHQVVLLDTLAIPNESLAPFASFLEDPDVTKVMHGSDNDIIGLQRDFSLRVTNLFDTVLAARFLNLPKRGLDHLLWDYCRVKTSKQFQRYDWTYRPIASNALRYAAGDAYYLLDMFQKMTDQLEAIDRLQHAVEDSELLAQREYTEKPFDPDSFWKLRGIKELRPKQVAVLQALFLWRHDVCVELNKAAFMVLDDRTMFSLARSQPQTPQELFRVRNVNRPQIRRHCQELIEIMEEGANSHPPRRPQRRKPKSKKEPVKERVFEVLRQWRNDTAQRDGFELDLLATKQVLLQIARACPKSIEELAELHGMTPWRIENYGEEWLTIIEQNL